MLVAERKIFWLLSMRGSFLVGRSFSPSCGTCGIERRNEGLLPCSSFVKVFTELSSCHQGLRDTRLLLGTSMPSGAVTSSVPCILSMLRQHPFGWSEAVQQ
jgi:hypothetical protein